MVMGKFEHGIVAVAVLQAIEKYCNKKSQKF
jgi:hypothetical protein